MLKLYKLCKLYNLHIEVEYDNDMDGMIFTFYNAKTRYKQCVPCIEIEHTRNIELLEDGLLRKVIDAFGLDNNL